MSAFAKLVLINTNLPELDKEYLMTRPLLIVGRSRESDVKIDTHRHPLMISRRHCQITREKDPAGRWAFKINDMGSLNGTFLNDIKISQSALNDGDVIMFIGGSETVQGNHHFPALAGKSIDEIKTYLITQAPKLAIVFQFFILPQSSNLENIPPGGTNIVPPASSSSSAPFAVTNPNNRFAHGVDSLLNARRNLSNPLLPRSTTSPLSGAGNFPATTAQWGVEIPESAAGIQLPVIQTISSAPRSPSDPDAILEEDLPQIVDDEIQVPIQQSSSIPENVALSDLVNEEALSSPNARKRLRQEEGQENMNMSISRNEDENNRDSDISLQNARNSNENSFEQVPKSTNESEEPAAKRKRTESSNNMEIEGKESTDNKENQNNSPPSSKLGNEEKIAMLEQKCKEHAQTVQTCKILKEFASALEEEITCVICQDLVLHATTLHCSHTFCRSCIQKWLQKNNICPVCRSKITQKPIKNVLLENIIEKYVLTLTETERSMRESRIKNENRIEEVEISKLQKMLAEAKKKGARFLKISEKWTEIEKDTFLRGCEKYHGKARIIYCEVCGLTEKFVNKCSYEELLRSVENLKLKMLKKKNPSNPTAPEVPDVVKTKELLIGFIQQGWGNNGMIGSAANDVGGASSITKTNDANFSEQAPQI